MVVIYVRIRVSKFFRDNVIVTVAQEELIYSLMENIVNLANLN